MIPRVIHYCWFGGKPLSADSVRMIETWRKHCPDYRIRRWDESNTELSSIPYLREAYLSGNYAHVSDVCRLMVLYQHGGIYLDTDVELTGSFDRFLNQESFIGMESGEQIGTGVIGALKGSEWLNRFLDYYRRHHFINIFGHAVRTPNTKILTRRIWPELPESIRPTLYGVDYFCANDWQTGNVDITPNTVCVHRYAAGWARKPKTLTDRVREMWRNLKIRYLR